MTKQIKFGILIIIKTPAHKTCLTALHNICGNEFYRKSLMLKGMIINMKKALKLPAFLMSVMFASIISTSTVFADEAYLTRKSMELEIGESKSIRLSGAEGKVKWQVSNSNVFKYSKGVVTAVGEGQAYIYATNNGKKYKCLVTVTSPNEEMSDISTVTLKKGQSRDITIDTKGKDIRVKSSNSKVCSISCGLITNNKFPLTIKGKSNGSCTITVFDYKNPSDCYSIKVKVQGSGITVSSKGSDISSWSDSSDNTSQKLDQSEFEDEIIRLVNIERESKGLEPLEKSDALMESAQIRAEEIEDKFSHTRPDGSSCFTSISGKGIKGENIAMGYMTPEQVFDAWINSDGHRDNILSTKFTEIGVGFNDGYNGWVQHFKG